jgi:hypothetical protein
VPNKEAVRPALGLALAAQRTVRDRAAALRPKRTMGLSRRRGPWVPLQRIWSLSEMELASAVLSMALSVVFGFINASAVALYQGLR